MAGRVAGNRRPQWSELQGDPLELILEKLDLAAHARFASVCSSWRSAAAKNPPINKPLYMALSHDPENLLRRFIISFVPSWDGCWFVGALDGWLLILIDGRDLFLLNKGSNSIIPLPPPPIDPEIFFERPQFFKAVLSSSPPSSPSPSSSGECTVVVIKHFNAGVFYCRLGLDKSFIKLSEFPQCAEDILFYKGRLYVLWYDRDLKTNNITIFDHLLNEVTHLIPHFGDGPSHHTGHYRLLISENKLLITVMCFRPVWVFEFEPSESRIVRVENINDNLLLLLNSFCSLSITRNEHKEFRKPANFDKFLCNSTFVLDTSEDTTKAKVGDPGPLFFVMFSIYGLHVW